MTKWGFNLGYNDSNDDYFSSYIEASTIENAIDQFDMMMFGVGEFIKLPCTHGGYYTIRKSEIKSTWFYGELKEDDQ